MSIQEIEKRMRSHNNIQGVTCKGRDQRPLKARVQFTADAFDAPLPESKRLYEFTSDNKAYIAGQSSNSIFLSRTNPDGDNSFFTLDVIKIYKFYPQDIDFAQLWVE